MWPSPASDGPTEIDSCDEAHAAARTAVDVVEVVGTADVVVVAPLVEVVVDGCVVDDLDVVVDDELELEELPQAAAARATAASSAAVTARPWRTGSI